MALQYLAQAFGAVLTPMNMGVLLLSTFAGLIMGMLPRTERHHGSSITDPD